MTLSGGMKRRVLIAKALATSRTILFLDEPTAGVDVELRKDMWQVVRELRASGVTIILTTHYIEEAEDMADRVGVINKGEIILVENKAELMRKLGKKRLTLASSEDSSTPFPPALAAIQSDARRTTATTLIYDYDTQSRAHRRRHAARRFVAQAGMRIRDLQTDAKFAGGHFRRTGERRTMNLRAVTRDLHVRDGAHRPHASGRASCRRCSRPRSISWCSARPSARASRRSRA